MPMHYSKPPGDSFRLPDIETFEAAYGYCPICRSLVFGLNAAIGDLAPCSNCADARRVRLQEMGWFYWFCFPGCLPDSEPFGPFATEEQALNDAREVGNDEIE